MGGYGPKDVYDKAQLTFVRTVDSEMTLELKRYQSPKFCSIIKFNFVDMVFIMWTVEGLINGSYTFRKIIGENIGYIAT